MTYYTWTLENVGYDAAQKIMPDSSAIEPEIWTCIFNSKSDVYNPMDGLTQDSILVTLNIIVIV